MSLKETCHCGHDKASHYRNAGAVSAEHTTCLCTGCACRLYANEFGPKPKKRLERPNHSTACECPKCREWRAQCEAAIAQLDVNGMFV